MGSPDCLPACRVTRGIGACEDCLTHRFTAGYGWPPHAGPPIGGAGIVTITTVGGRVAHLELTEAGEKLAATLARRRGSSRSRKRYRGKEGQQKTTLIPARRVDRAAVTEDPNQ